MQSSVINIIVFSGFSNRYFLIFLCKYELGTVMYEYSQGHMDPK
jgi:hypothetical protein